MQESINNIHVARLSGENDKAKKLIKELSTRTQLSGEQLVAALVLKDFKKSACERYLKKLFGDTY